MAFFHVRRSGSDSSQKFPVLPALLLVGAALLGGCHPAAVTDPNDPKFIVAEKGNWHILRGELDSEVANFLKQQQATPEQVGSKMPMVQTMMLKNMVLKKLMLDKAATMQLTDVEKDEAAQLDILKQSIPPGQDLDQQLKASGMTLDDLKQKIHEQVLIHKVLEAEAFKDVAPTDQEIDAIYLQHKDSFTIPEKIRASRILMHVDDTTSAAEKAAKKKAIDKAHARVAKGEAFSQVAMEVSEDQSSKSKGGDLGYFARGENPDAGFDDVAFSAKLNAVSPVFLTPLGYQFLKVTDIQPPGVVPEADVRPKIAAYLRQQNMQKKSQAYAMKLLADANVTYHFVLVDPPAQVAPAPAGPDSAPPPSGAPDSAPEPPPAAAGGAPTQ
jgi:parvulin-like peptidyl-prolyl isomerase